MTDDIDFDFINEVAQKVTNFFYDDSDREKWFLEIIDYYNKNECFPDDAIQKINDFLIDTGDKDYLKLVDDVNSIAKEEDNAENLLSTIFFPQEDDYYVPEQNEFIIDEEEEEQAEIDNHDPQSYFNSIITDLMTDLCMSHDIAYVLLKKYSWNKEKITEEWFSKQDEILKSLHIKINSEMVPDFKSPLSIKKIGKGECPICLEEKELYKFYCGHSLCKECIESEIKHLMSENNVFVCRQDCNAEIMPNDVKKFLNNEEFEKYQKIVLRKEIALDPNVKECTDGNCNGIITPVDSLPCHVGRCPHCNSVTCLRCNRGAHAPLIRCEAIDEFTTKISEEMAQLEQDQESWFKREAELQSYRRDHSDEVTKVFDNELEELVKKQNKKMTEENQRIDEIGKELNDFLDKISNLTRKQTQLKNEHKPPNEIEKIDLEINSLRDIYNQKAGYRERLQRDKHVNDSERKLELETAKKERKLFLDAIRDPSMYQRKIYEFEMSLNTRAYQNVNITSNDDDLVSTMTKKCPKCQAPIERNDGCNHMTCQICHYQFCYVCEEPWETHSNYYVCPKYKKDVVVKNTKGVSKCGIDFSNKSDKKFYPLPMSIEKRSDFMRWNNLYTQYRMQREKYDDLFKELHNTVDKLHEGKDIPIYKLCPIKKLIKVLSLSYNDGESKERATKIINTLLFAQSVVMYGYPSLYFMMKEPRKASVFEYKISKIDENKNNLLHLIRDANIKSTATDFTIAYDIISSSILDALEMAETFA